MGKSEILSHKGEIISIDKVHDEVYKYHGELKAWCMKNLPAYFFHDTKNVIKEYTEVVSWANSKSGHYHQKAISDFMSASAADAWLISFAKANNLILVTYESSEPLRRTSIKIPDVCKALNLPCMNTVKMFRHLGESF